MIEAEHKSGFEPTKYTPYLTLTGELWVVYCEDLGENWLCYKTERALLIGTSR